MGSNGCSENFSHARLEEYIAKKVLPKLQMEGRPFKIRPTELGNRNIIYFLHIDNFQDTVFKGFAKKNRLKNNLIANRFLARCNIKVPRTIFSDLSQSTYKKFGRFFACEEKAAGKPFSESNEIVKSIPFIAGFYAEMHGIRSSRWGKLTSGKKYGFTSYVMTKVTKRINVLKKSDTSLKAQNFNEFIKWFESAKGSLKKIKYFSLCHGDVNKKNILLSDSNQVCIVDNEAIKYLPFPMEFYRLKYVLGGDSVESQTLFEESYFESCSPERRREFESCNLFYNAYVLLELALYHNKKFKHHKAQEHLKDYFETNRDKALTEIKDLVLMAS